MSQHPPYNMNRHTNTDGDEAVRRPRRPNAETEARLLHGAPPVTQPQSTMSNHKLSVNAPEFVPRGCSVQVNQARPYGMPPPPFPPLPGLLLSPGAAEFVPRPDFGPVPPNVLPNIGPPPQMAPQGDALFNSFSQMNLGREVTQPNQLDQTNQLFIEFSNTMMILTTHPGNIRDFLLPLCDKLRQAQTKDILYQVIDVLYQQSVYEPNFRYTGARVCHFMCNELKDHPVFGNFKMEFLKKCQQDYNRREELLKMGDEGLAILCGLALFMGELFLNVTADASGETERLDFLPNVLTDLLLTLLSQPSDVTVKNTCQLLKLAGGPTEDAMSQKSEHDVQNFQRIFTILHSLLSSQHISQNMKHLINSVLNLRQNNWGRPDNRAPHPGDSHHSSAVPPPEFLQAEPVFYNEHGKPITREEAGYTEEEEEEDSYGEYVLTEEEEREFQQFQEEQRLATNPPSHNGDHNLQLGYGEAPVYQQWSTNDSGYGYDGYTQQYDYNTYQGYSEDDGLGLTMDDEAEKAYDEFLSSQRGPPMGQ